MSEIFTIVFLCTANQARSVIAQACTCRATEGFPVAVLSAGVRAQAGRTALPDAVRAAKAMGVDLSAHRSACMPDIDLGSADLILGFELQHVAHAVVEGHAPPEKVFHLKEFIELASPLPRTGTPDHVERARAVVASANRNRSGRETFAPHREIADPVGRNATFFQRTFEEICSLCERLVDCLFPGTGDGQGQEAG